MTKRPPQEPFQCGDVVLHLPTGETWIVAAADHAADDLAWFGWPEGLARASDCVLVERAWPETSMHWHGMLSGMRRAMADRVYGDLETRRARYDAAQPFRFAHCANVH